MGHPVLNHLMWLVWGCQICTLWSYKLILKHLLKYRTKFHEIITTEALKKIRQNAGIYAFAYSQKYDFFPWAFSTNPPLKKKRYVGGVRDTNTMQAMQWCQYSPIMRSKWKQTQIQNQFIKHVQKYYIIILQEYNFMLQHDVSKFCRILILEKTPSSTFNEKKALVGAFSKYCGTL